MLSRQCPISTNNPMFARSRRVAFLTHFHRFVAAGMLLAVLAMFSENHAMSQTIEELKQQQLIDEAKTSALNAQAARVRAE